MDVDGVSAHSGGVDGELDAAVSDDDANEAGLLLLRGMSSTAVDRLLPASMDVDGPPINVVVDCSCSSCVRLRQFDELVRRDRRIGVLMDELLELIADDEDEIEISEDETSELDSDFADDDDDDHHMG